MPELATTLPELAATLLKLAATLPELAATYQKSIKLVEFGRIYLSSATLKYSYCNWASPVISTTLINKDESYIYKQVINGLNSKKWIKAIIEEIKSLIKN